jgi:hypothetical protein
LAQSAQQCAGSVQSQQSEQQRAYRWHMYLSQSEIREKYRDPTGQ